MTLHCCYQAVDSPAGRRLAQQAVAGEAVLLLGKAVCVRRAELEPLQQRGLSLYMLREDLELYGAALPPGVTVIDYDSWVDLCIDYDTQMVWR